MNLDRNSIIAAIKNEIVRIASTLDCDASELRNDELIPASGYIDSAGLIELIAWFEHRFELTVSAEDFTVDKLGCLDAMADFALQCKTPQ